MERTIVIIAVLLAGCSSPSVPAGLLVETGTYPSPSGKWILDVFRSEGTLIKYEIKGSQSDVAFRPEYDFSDVHRWAFFWESDTRLWCYSSDIGTSLWTLGNTGVWTEHGLTPDSKYNQEIPEPLYQYLPSSLKRMTANKNSEENSSNKAAASDKK